MPRPPCKHSKGVERYWGPDGYGHCTLFCYSCGKDINATRHEDCEGDCKDEHTPLSDTLA